MNRVLVLVEGQTERAIIEQVLAPHFGTHGLSLHAKLLGKPGHKGGIRAFDAVRTEALALLRQEPRSFVSTFLDYYGLPASWPGIGDARGKAAQEKARIVEVAMHESVRQRLVDPGHLRRFLPCVQMHELEALLFVDPKLMAEGFERPDLAEILAEIVQACGECEEINDHPETAPSRGIVRLFPSYRKGASLIAHAPIIARRIGLGAMRRACPHFNAWLTKIENLGVGSHGNADLEEQGR